MAILKNIADQKLGVFAYDSTTGAAKTGDAANITAYISKDFASPVQTTDVNPTELDATNAPGWYVFDMTQAETNAEVLVLAAKSVTASVLIEQIQVVTQDAALSTLATAAALAVVDDYVDTEVAAIKVVTDKLGTTLELDGAVYRYTANALEQAPAATATVSISATTAASVASGSLGIRTFHTFSQAITSTSTAALNTATKVWLAIKTRVSDADSASQVFIEAAGGLTVLGGATYATVGHGTLVVSGSSGAWVITLGLDEVATGLLTAGSYVAEVKALVGANTVAVWDGDAVVSAGIVRAVV